MARLIDADKLPYIKAPIAPILVGDEVVWRNIVYKLHIDDAPTVDAVEVVRCRDCDIGTCYSDDSVQCEWSNGFYADDYCPRGKRKGGDE